MRAFEILKFLGIDSDDMRPIFSPNDLMLAGPEEVAFSSKGTLETVLKSSAGIVLVNREVPYKDRVLIPVDNPRLEFIRICDRFFPPKQARISIGENCNISHMAFIGKDGFGFERLPTGEIIHFPHYAGVRIGDDVEIGSFTAVDRGVFMDTEIASGTKIDNLVHVAHNVKIGSNCLIVAGTVLGGGVEIGDNSYLGIGVTVKPHIKIGKNVYAGMRAVITKDVPDNTVVLGHPARKYDPIAKKIIK